MKKKLLLFLLVLSLANYLANAQSCYDVVQVPYQPAPYVGTNVISDSASFLQDDVFSSVISIGFNFCFFDATYDSLLISTNGYVTFNTFLANQYSPWPIAAEIPDSGGIGGTPLNAIMCPWQDMLPPSGGTISYELQGIAPYRRFVVSYNTMPMYLCTGIFFTNQLVLYETTNVIEMNLKEKPVCDTWNGGLAIEGIQNSNGTEAYIVPGRNYPNQWTAYYDSWRFIPTCGCAGPAPSNLITGKIYADYDNDCTYNGTDIGISNQWVLANNGQFYAYSDNNGDYSLWTDTGTYDISHTVLNYFSSKCPPGGVYNVSFPTTNDTLSDIDFADTTNVLCADLSVDIGVPNLSQCFYEYGGIMYCNNGTVPDNNVNIIVTFPDSLQLTSSSVPSTPLGNGQYQFDVGSLGLGACGFISFTIDVGCDTVGTVLCMDAVIAGSATDCDTTNNTAMDCHPVIASFDPNGKEVASQSFESEGYVMIDTITAEDDLTFLIHFQNTGMDTAYNITVKDTISDFLDPTTIEPGASSHPYSWLVQNNVLTFQFSNIKLPDSNTNPAASVGFVKFKIRQAPLNLPGTIIPNRAAIYFDYNLPIITNTTLDVIPHDIETSVHEVSSIEAVIYPNPFNDKAEVIVNSELDNLWITVNDVFGRQVMVLPITNHRAILQADMLESGMYFFTISEDGKKLKAGKLVVD